MFSFLFIFSGLHLLFDTSFHYLKTKNKNKNENKNENEKYKKKKKKFSIVRLTDLT